MGEEGDILLSSETKNLSPTVTLGDSHSLQLTTKLNVTNYLVQSRSFQLAVTARGLLGYIKGVTKSLMEDGPARDKWNKENVLVMTWLLNSIHPKISRSFVLMDIVHEIWTAAYQMYSQWGNDAQAYEL